MQVTTGLAARALAQITRSLAHIDQLLNCVGRQILRATESTRKDGDLRSVLERFQAIECLPSISAVGNGAMISHQQRVVMLNQRAHRLAQLVG